MKPTCGTYATTSFKTLPQTCFSESGGQLAFEAESYRTTWAGTDATGRTCTPTSASSSASGGVAMTVSNANINAQNNLTGPGSITR